ncbi:hypothetical protein O6H91_11G034000 [Diphasiastrum complanatum]|uniref:Uncharacterized protein n=2 Tax=Diphasiastrum complanatum TaxID=34168 RepID=A0ACC2C7X5_DIPCM|nr:hypothetical protein O6H91_11G034000 [Diphasiastrum complanatum]KAJ7538101.1 hypothetical protein O6H91_11G034000 [Diphasiastrum complanatum]
MCVVRKNVMKNHEAIGVIPQDADAESIPECATHESNNSSPRFAGGTGSVIDDQSCLKSEDLTIPRVKFLCSYGGKICPRPHDYQLRYVMGETKIVVVSRNIAYADLMAKLTKLAGRPIVLKYQLPYEDLDALVSVVSDDDLQNMLEEYEKAESRNFSCRLRLFLFPKKWPEDTNELLGGSSNPEQQFVDAVNSALADSNKQREAPVNTSEVLDFLFGLDSAPDAPSNPSAAFQVVQGVRLTISDSSALTAPQMLSSISVPVHEHSIAQPYGLPIEQVQCSKGQVTRQLSREKLQESSFLLASPHSPKTGNPFHNLLQCSDSDKQTKVASEGLSPFSQRDLRDHRNACSSPLGRVDAGNFSNKPLMNPVAESSFWIDHGRDAQLDNTEEMHPVCYNLQLKSQMQTAQQFVSLPGRGLTPTPLQECYNRAPSDAFGASSPEVQQKKYLEIQQDKNKSLDVLQRGSMDMERNSRSYWKPLADIYQKSEKMNFFKQPEEQAPLDKTQNVGYIPFDTQEEKGNSSDRPQLTYVSEISSGFLCRQLETGDLASSFLQHHHQQQLLNSNSPLMIGQEKYWRGYQQQQQNESLSGMCSSCSTEFSVKAMLPQYPVTVTRPAILHVPSKLITSQTPISGDILCPRQVCQSLQQPRPYFNHVPSEATFNGQLPRTSCLSKDQVAPLGAHRSRSPSRFKANAPSRFFDQNAQTMDRSALPLQYVVSKSAHDDPAIDLKKSITSNSHTAQVYAEQFQKSSFHYSDGNVYGNLSNDSSCNKDLLSQSNEVQGMMDTKSRPIYHGVKG